MFYDVFCQLCKQKGVSPTRVSIEVGFSRGSVSYWRKQWKQGVDAKPDSYTVEKIADYFGVSIDYLLGRTDDPINYDTDGDILAEIPLSYVEAANGDMKKARAIMLAAEKDAKGDAIRSMLGRFSRRDAELVFALWGDDKDIDDKDLEDVKRFAAFVKEKKKKDDDDSGSL